MCDVQTGFFVLVVGSDTALVERMLTLFLLNERGDSLSSKCMGRAFLPSSDLFKLLSGTGIKAD